MSTPTMSTAPTQQSQPMTTITIECIKLKDWLGEHKTYNLLVDDNWQSWHDDITLTFRVCSLDNYVNGTIQCPDPNSDAIGTNNWKYNDMYTKKVIHDCLSASQKYHTLNCETAKEMWTNLQAIHQSCGNQTKNQLICELTNIKAHDGDDIIEHLAKLKQLWDHITLVCQTDLPLSPKLFKKFLAYSLPPTWDEFT